MNTFNEQEFLELCNRFDTAGNMEDVTLKYNNSSFFNKMKLSVQKDRRGEVVFCVKRKNGRVIAITCNDYPKGVFRIPTGGIGHGEDIVGAVFREVKEELGLDVAIERFAGVLKIRFQHEDQSFMFFSYIFLLSEKGGRLLLDASDDEIGEVREVDIDGLSDIVEHLGSIQGKWNDWGKFRYVTSKAVLEALKNGNVN